VSKVCSNSCQFEFVNRACERPPAGRFAPRLSPFVRGTFRRQPLAVDFAVSPLRRGTAVERSDRQGVAHKPCFDYEAFPIAICLASMN
jgi:hypothetical protein